jgi:hypothetical protein
VGTTRDMLAAGSSSFVWVAAIEGLNYLLHSHSSSSAVVTAFAALSGGDYTAGLGGLFVELDNQQSLHPYEPFHGGGRCSLRVTPDSDDTFGIDTHRMAAGFETELTETLDHDATTVKVKSTADFDSSGTVYIGTEAISYTGKTATAFTGCTRGKYSPHAAYGSETSRFGAYHRVGKDAQSVDLAPIVSSQPRGWIGKRVAVWMVRVVGGVLDTVAESQLVYSGRIVEIRDDANSFATCVDLRHVLDECKDTTVGREIWSAKIPAGIYMQPGWFFRMKDRTSGANAYSVAGSLEVVAGASDYDEIEPGMYSVEQIHSILETWWNGARTDGDLNGTYSIRIDTISGGDYRTKIYSIIPGVANANVDWRFEMPSPVADLFGYTNFVRTGNGQANEEMDHEVAEGPPLRATFLNGSVASGPTFNWNRLTVYDERGLFLDNLNFMPFPIVISDPTAGTGTTLEWGLFLINETTLVWGARSDDDIGHVYPASVGYGGANTDIKQFQKVAWSPDAPDFISIRQIPYLESTCKTVLNTLFYSTGTEGYNSSSYDGLPYGFGLGLPGGILGAQFEASTNNLPGSDDKLTVVIDKPMTLAELLGGDLMLRRVFPLWRDQGLVFGSWRTPTSDAASLTLSESNKAEPSGSEGTQRSALTITDEWQRPVVKILYARNFNELGSESYASVITLEDKTAVDDAGGIAQPATVKARNASSDVSQLVSNFLATMPMFSRPTIRVARSIDSRFWEEIAVGDVVLWDDDFSRDPTTGRRGISGRAALVVKHRWSPGGFQPGNGDKAVDAGGEVELLITERNATLSGALYAPAADIDDTYGTGDYDAGYDPATKTIKCYERRYNQSVEYYVNGFPVLDEESADASYFEATYKVRIIERDPASAANPQVWEDTVASRTGNFVTLTTGLAGFDTTKKYRIVFDDYDAVVTTQKTKAFQADDADGMILDLSAPYTYTSSASRNHDSNSLTEIELIPSAVFQDGAGRDVGSEAALMRLLDNEIDYKTALNCPVLFNTVRINNFVGATYKLLYLAPIMLTREGLSNAVIRELHVAPWFRSQDGRTVNVRVTLCRDRPTTGSLYNVNRGTVYSEMTRSTTSTTWQKASASQLDCRVKTNYGIAWLMIEGSFRCEVRGLHQCSEGPRLQPQAWVI